MARLLNEMSWSRSRISTLDSCKRQYFYQYYLKWEGWERNAPDDRQRAYRLSKMKNLALLCGQAVHETIKRLITDLRDLGHPSFDDAPRQARLWLSDVWRGAEQEKWRQSVKYNPPLFELYYGPAPAPHELKAIGAKAGRCMETFLASSLWAELQEEGGENWLAVDEAPSFDDDANRVRVDGRTVWALPDFARRVDGDSCEIWDWKTGAKNPHDEKQLLSYALFARDVWEFPADHIRLKGYYLDGNKVVDYPCNAGLLSEMEEEIRRDFGLMASLLEDPANNVPKPADEAFPMIDNMAQCRRCFFKEMCGRNEGVAGGS